MPISSIHLHSSVSTHLVVADVCTTAVQHTCYTHHFAVLQLVERGGVGLVSEGDCTDAGTRLKGPSAEKGR